MINDDTKITENKSLISDVSKFRKSLSTVKSDDTLFEKKAYKDENGNEKMDYDYDKIYDRLSSFAKAYNAVVEAGAESDSSTVLRNTLSMTNAVNASKKTLTAVGFRVNSECAVQFRKWVNQIAQPKRQSSSLPRCKIRCIMQSMDIRQQI